jgi:DNA-binding transcriptional ArsR family regulator
LTERKRLGAEKQALMLRKLVSGSATYAELEAMSGQSHLTVANWLKALRQRGLTYVWSWDNDMRGYPTIPRFSWGVDEQDAMRPSIPANVRAKALRDKRKVVVNE